MQLGCRLHGRRGDGAGSLALVERWDGTSWSVQQTPSDTGGLDAVSCRSATFCMAVGGNVCTGCEAQAVVWRGVGWSTAKPANVEPAEGDELFSVSCLSAGACTAIGTATTTAGVAALAEAWNGATWRIQTTPPETIREGRQRMLYNVSCVSANACTAVGTSQLTLAEAWNGSAWAVQNTPNPVYADGIDEGQLYGVSCSTAKACTAVGYSGIGVVLAERWNDSTWAVQKTPNPTGSGNRLIGVSCSTANSCIAVGTADAGTMTFLGVPVAEVWNGLTWTLHQTPRVLP